MTDTKILCIGGPMDGRRVNDIGEKMNAIVASQEPISFDDPPPPSPHVKDFRTVEYRKERLRSEGIEHFVYILAGLYDPFGLMIANYRSEPKR